MQGASARWLQDSNKVLVTRNEPEKLSIIVAKRKEVECCLTGEYGDYSKNILQEPGIDQDEDDDGDVECEAKTVHNEDIQM